MLSCCGDDNNNKNKITFSQSTRILTTNGWHHFPGVRDVVCSAMSSVDIQNANYHNLGSLNCVQRFVRIGINLWKTLYDEK